MPSRDPQGHASAPHMPKRAAAAFTRRQVISTAVLLIAIITVVAGLLHPADDDFLRYHNKTVAVVRVIDGDTLTIDVTDGGKAETAVRLWGVDTPETKHPKKSVPDYFGPEASEFTTRLAGGQQVRLELVTGQTRDRHGRLLAYVFLPDNEMLNEQILRSGHGYADWRYAHPRMQRFLSLEQQAARAKAGLWKNVRTDQMPDWRQQPPPTRRQ